MAYGIDIGASSLKVVALRRTLGGFRVVGAGRRRIPKIAGDPKPVMQKLLYDAMGGGEGKRVGVVGVSGRDVNLQVVNQPKTTAVNYRQLMGYEVEQRRGAAGDLYADWCTLREPDPYFPQYLAMVGVAKSAFINDRISTAGGARVEVRDAVPNAFALFEVYRNCYDLEGGTQLLLDIGADNIDMALVRGGRLIFARNVSTGSRVFDTNLAGSGGTSPEEAEARKIQYGNLGPPADDADPREEEMRPAMRTGAGQLAGIINSSVQFAKTQLQDRELAVDKVYLSGGGARLRGFKEYLAGALKLPIEVLDPFRRINAKALEEVEDFRQLPSDMAVAIGLAMISASNGRGPARISIVPDLIRKRRNFAQGPLYLVVGGAILLAVMLVVTAVGFVRKAAHESALADFTARTKSVSDRITELDKVEAQQRDVVAKSEMLLAQGLAGRGAVDIISKLRKVLPEGVNVRKVEFSDLSGRPHNPLPKRRCLFHLPGRGLVIGALVKDAKDGEGNLVMANGESVPSVEAGEVKMWQAPSRGVQVEGEIDENIKGGASATLDSIKNQLNDPSRGVAAEIPFQEAAKGRPGWREFRILVRFE